MGDSKNGEEHSQPASVGETHVNLIQGWRGLRSTSQHMVLWEWVGTRSSPSLTLAAWQMCLFLPFPLGRQASGRVVRQAGCGGRLPGVQILALIVEIQNLRLTGMLPFPHL